MKTIIKRGLIAIAPLSITIAIFYWLFSMLETALGPFIRDLIGPKYYFPGLGVLCALIIIFLIGALLNTWIIKHLANYFERIFNRIPLFKSLYNMIKNVMQFLHASPGEHKQQVVQVSIDGSDLIGLVTCDNFSHIPEMDTDRIAVFFPMSYQIGGYTLLVPRSKIKLLNISMETALQNTLTAWAKASPPKKPNF